MVKIQGISLIFLVVFQGYAGESPRLTVSPETPVQEDIGNTVKAAIVVHAVTSYKPQSQEDGIKVPVYLFKKSPKIQNFTEYWNHSSDCSI